MKSVPFTLLVAACVGGALCATISDTAVEDDTWWGPECETENNNTSIEPFKIKFPNEMIEDLKYRLNNHRPFRAPLTDDFSYGFNSDHMEEWMQYCAKEYPFEERECCDCLWHNANTHYLCNGDGLGLWKGVSCREP